MLKRKNILVTGGAGYIGSILVPELLKAGYRVTVVDNFLYRQESLTDVCHHKELEIINGDVRNKDLMKKLIKQADIIIPLACLVGAPLCDKNPIDAKAVNLEAIKTILELRDKKQKILFPTTNSGYGVGEQGKYCTEETPLRPISLYGQLKVEAEKLILESGNAITFRLATVFGIAPRMRRDLLVNDFVYRAVNDGVIVLFQAHFKRNYIHIRDVAKAFLHAISNFDNMKDQPYNVGLSKANLSKAELCAEIKKQVPKLYVIEESIGKDPDKRDYIVSNKKIEETGFKPDYSLHDGITELIKGYKIFKENKYTNL